VTPPGASAKGATVVLVVTIALTPRFAHAYRPFVSTDAAVADPGDVEIEFGAIGFRSDHGRTSIIAPTVTANLGVGRDLEVVGEFKLVSDVEHRNRTETTRFEDSAVSLKWVAHDGVLQAKEREPSLALELSLLLPTIRGEDRPGGELIGIASGILPGVCRYHLNAGALVEPGGDEPGVIWGVILERAVTESLRAVLEVNGEAVRGSPGDNSALVGAIWTVPAPKPLNGLALDVGLRHGLGRGDEWGGTAGFTFAFPLWREGGDP
jgi:hypothetical protein